MKKFFSAIMAIAVMTVSFTSCEGNEPDDNGNGNTEVTTIEIARSIGSGETLHLKADEDYLLNGPLIVEDGGTLTIDAGTVIKAKKGFSNYILVLQGGKINANGTAEKPIKMTANIDNAESGHWGGLVINGKAPLTSGQATGSTEINSAYIYGGTDANDNSGVLTYVILEYTGHRSSADVEHNGLTLNGVGNGTKIENIYVYEGADDGIEFFGGSVNVKNLLVVNSDDDMFDFTQGYNGTLENAYGIWEKGFTSTEADPRGIEADGNLDGNFAAHTNQSNFTVKNMTIDLRLDHNNDKTTQMQDVIKIRRGAKATVINALVKGVGATGDLIDMTDKKGFGDTASSISLTNALTNPFAGKEVNNTLVTKDKEGNVINTETHEFPNVKIEAGNTGCPTNIFGWTGYAF